MNDLTNKKNLAARTLKVGKNRLHFSGEHLTEIKEAITKQDIRELYAEGIIQIKPIGGRRKIIRRKTKRGPGKIKRTINNRKQIYVKITRKLRRYLKDLKRMGEIENSLYIGLRKKIKMREFKSKAHLKEYLEDFKKVGIKKKDVKKEDKVKPKIKEQAKEKKTTKKTKTKEKEE